MMKSIRLRKGECFSDKSPQRLSKRVIPTFHMRCFAGFLADRLMCFFRENSFVCLPEITECKSFFIVIPDFIPQFATGFNSASADNKSDYLASTPAKCYPQPTFANFFQHKTAQFVQFKCVSRFIRNQGLFNRRQFGGFLLEPCCNGLPAHAENSLDSSQTCALSVTCKHCPSIGLSVLFLRIQGSIRSAIFAVELRIPATVRAVFNQVVAFANRTLVNNCFVYHDNSPELLFAGKLYLYH